MKREDICSRGKSAHERAAIPKSAIFNIRATEAAALIRRPISQDLKPSLCP